MTPETPSGRILIVDDLQIERRKLSLAVEALGHRAVAVSGGAQALAHLEASPVDAVLLDLEMPLMGGHEVLAWLKAHPRLKAVPVIVISSLEDDLDEVIRAIGGGAEDFLPKHVERALLNARLAAAVRKKRHRDRELDQLRQIERLTHASTLIERGGYNPQRMGVGDIGERGDPLGRFARVFVGMAQQLHDREARLRRQIRTLNGIGVLLLIGLLCGLDPPLARFTAGFGAHPVGLAVWINVVVCLCTLPVALLRRDLPALNRYSLVYFLLWGLCSVMLGDVLLIVVAGHIEASVLSILLMAEVLMVFAWAALSRSEPTSAKRLLGLFTGMLGVAVLVLQRSDGASAGWGWTLMALGVPLGFAVIDFLSENDDTVRCGDLSRAGFASLAGLSLLLPLALQQQAFVAPWSVPPELSAAILLWGMLDAVTITLAIMLIRSSGAVFGSQLALVQTLAGIGLGALLLGEVLSVQSWIAFAIVAIGLLLVEPRREPEAPIPAELLREMRGDPSGTSRVEST